MRLKRHRSQFCWRNCPMRTGDNVLLAAHARWLVVALRDRRPCRPGHPAWAAEPIGVTAVEARPCVPGRARRCARSRTPPQRSSEPAFVSPCPRRSRSVGIGAYRGGHIGPRCIEGDELPDLSCRRPTIPLVLASTCEQATERLRSTARGRERGAFGSRDNLRGRLRAGRGHDATPRRLRTGGAGRRHQGPLASCRQRRGSYFPTR